MAVVHSSDSLDINFITTTIVDHITASRLTDGTGIWSADIRSAKGPSHSTKAVASEPPTFERPSRARRPVVEAITYRSRGPSRHHFHSLSTVITSVCLLPLPILDLGVHNRPHPERCGSTFRPI